MANPQKEEGFTAIANEIMDALCRIRIPGEERQVLDCILRKTYGWQKTEDAIALSQFAEMTGIKKPNVIGAIKGLLSKKIISVIQKDNASAKVYRFNKDFEQWQPLSKKITLSKKIIGVMEKDNPSLSKTIPTKETTTKETITKEKRGTFQVPTLQEISIYCKERKNKINPQQFLDFYTAKNWMIGKNKMKDWKAAVRTWEQREGNNGNTTGNQRPISQFRGNFKNNNSRELDPAVAAEAERLTAEYEANLAAANGSNG